MKNKVLSIILAVATIFGVIATLGLNVGAQGVFFEYPDSNPYWLLFADDSTDSPYLLVTFNATSDGREIALTSTGNPADGVEIQDPTYYVINASAQGWKQAENGSVYVDYTKLIFANVRVYDEQGYLLRNPYDYGTLIDGIKERTNSIASQYEKAVGSYEGTYTAPQGLTGISFAVYRTSALLSDTAALTHYARVASLCSRNEDGSPKQIFSANDIKAIVAAHEGEYIALFNYYPTTENPDVEEGLITMSVAYDPVVDTFEFIAQEWIQHDRYIFADLLDVRYHSGMLTGDVWGDYGEFLWTEYQKVGECRMSRVTLENNYRVELSESSVQLEALASKTVRATVKNGKGEALTSDTELTWYSSDTSVVRVDGENWGESGYEYATATLTGASAGTATVTAELNNYRLATLSVTVTGDGVLEVEKDIAVFTTEKSFCVRTGESISLGFGLLSGTKLDGVWSKMALSVSDPTVLSVSRYTKTEFGYTVSLNGLREGVSHLTVTDTASGANTSLLITVRDRYARTYSYAVDSMTEFYPQNEHERELLTNIYDLNGLYVNNYRYLEGETEGYVSFDVYNSKYHTGSVDIFSADGEWVQSIPIERFTDISSLWDTGEQAFYFVYDLKNKRLQTYEQGSFSKHTSVKFTLPKGGYFTISNNFSESVGTMLYNSIDLVCTGFTTALEGLTVGASKEEVPISELYDLVFKEFEDDKTAKEKFFELTRSTLQQIIIDEAKSIDEGNVHNGSKGLINAMESVLLDLDINLKEIYKLRMGLTEAAFAKFAGPAGKALDLAFSMNEKADMVLQAICLACSIDEPYAGVYTNIAEGFINPYGVVVNTNGNVDAAAALQVFRVNEGGAPDGIGEAKYELYNICFVRNDTTVQPNGKVKVYIPIPNGLKKDTCTVYRQEPSGLWMALDAVREENYLVFETEHFSLYAVVGEQEQMRVATLPDRLAYTVGDIIDRAGLTLKVGEETVTSGFVCEPAVFDTAGEQTVTARYGDLTASFTVTVAEQPNPTPDTEKDTEETPDQVPDSSEQPKDTSHASDTEAVAESTEPTDGDEKKGSFLPVAVVAGVGIVMIALCAVGVCLVRKRR